MSKISERTENYLHEEIIGLERILVLTLDSQHKILNVHSSKPDWQIPDLQNGKILPEALVAVLDAAGRSDEVVVFPYVGLGQQVFNVHVVCEGPHTEVILHDVTEAHDQERVLQQHGHEISLLSDQQAILNTELAQLNKELSLSKKKAEKASEAKSQFIATMSHEFRSPITSIMGYTKLLRSELPDSANPQAVQRASWYLLMLVENLLEQSRDGDESHELNPTQVSLTRLMRDIGELFQTQADAKGVGLSVDLNSDEVEVEIDELRLRQILINLLSNALRYTTAGQVSLTAGHREGLLSISVCDSGIGIASDDLERIFEPFTHVGENAALGAGLGLTITRQLIERMNGQLEVESTVGVGSEFRLMIPCQGIEKVSHDNAVLSGDVLWVDDDQDILSLYQVYLEDWGLTVHTASTVAQAKEAMQRCFCPVVISDLYLTDGNGFELMQNLFEKWPAIEGIIISGAGNAGLALESKENGIRAFLNKPVDLEALRDQISTSFSRASTNHVV